MKWAIVVYESVFGDAEAIARSVGEGLAGAMQVDVVPAGTAPDRLSPDVVLLVVGGPNHALGLPKESSRRQSAADAGVEPASGDTGLREWFAALEGEYADVASAAFDTRLDHPRVLKHVDHASHTEERHLRRLGFYLLAPAEHFYVTSAQGPLVDGEVQRAVRWGEHLAQLIRP